MQIDRFDPLDPKFDKKQQQVIKGLREAQIKRNRYSKDSKK